MAPRVYEENLVATFVAAGGIANINAPTVAEIGLGTNYSSYIRKNGLTWPSGRGTVPTDTIDRKHNSTYPGSESGTFGLTMLIENRAGATAAWTQFQDGEIEGYWIIGYEGSNGAAADVVDVIHSVNDRPVRNNPGPDENQMFTNQWHIQDAAYGVAVAA